MAQPWWKPVWTKPAALRAVRAAVVIPALVAITDKVIADPQMALFATFGGFATLIIAGFSGTRRDLLTAHLGLAVTGSLALIIGTLVSGTTWLAALVTVPVAFAIFFGGIGGPNAASGSTAAMFAYVLPVASAGDAGMIPSRLAGWWLASAAGTIAVLLMAPRAPGSRLRGAAAAAAGELASRVRAAAAGEMTDPGPLNAAKERLRTAFNAAPYRPTGLATADQALSSLVQLLEWGTAQVNDAFDGHIDLTRNCAQDRALLRAAAGLFEDTRALLAGEAADPDFAGTETARAQSAEHLRDLSGRPRPGEPDVRLAAVQAVHAQGLAVVAESAAADALIVSHHASPAAVSAARRQWYGTLGNVPARSAAGPVADSAPAGGLHADQAYQAGRLAALARSPRVGGLAGAAALLRRHATVRSVWFLNSLRGAIALAAAVAVADLSGVQHAFWVVLGTLSVLRTSASSTGATAWRGLAGTTVGFIVGAALLVGIGTAEPALWVALCVAVLVAAYAPGTTPFLVGQAAFTVTIVVLFNLLAPAGWKVGLLRVEDVAIGCAVSLVVGVVFWPRGAASIVGDDLADAFRSGAVFLSQSVDWALSEQFVPPAAAIAAAGAGTRLDDAVRGLLTEQGSKRLAKDDLWALVNASTRLRLTARTLAGLRPPVLEAGSLQPGTADAPGAACVPLAGSEEYAGATACVMLRSEAGSLAGFYTAVADEMGKPGSSPLAPVPPPPLEPGAMPRRKVAALVADGITDASGVVSLDAASPDVTASGHQLTHPHLLWVQEHLHHLSISAQTVSAPALRLAEVRQRPWWR
jgi:hypothetical protein